MLSADYFYNAEDDAESSFSVEDQVMRITRELARIKIDFAAPFELIRRVALLFRSIGVFVSKDPRTICGTNVTPLNGKSFIYFGIEKSLTRQVQAQLSTTYPETLLLHIFIDGIRLYKSSSKGFWPIVGSVLNTAKSTPFVIACYCGDSKPTSLREFLREFIQEYCILKEEGFSVAEKVYKVKIKAIICDAQARAFIKGSITTQIS